MYRFLNNPFSKNREAGRFSALLEFFSDTPTAEKNEENRLVFKKWKEGEKVTRETLANFVMQSFARSKGNFDVQKKIIECAVQDELLEKNVVLVAADMFSEEELKYISDYFHQFHKNLKFKKGDIKVGDYKMIVPQTSDLRKLIRKELAKIGGVYEINESFDRPQTRIKLRKLLRTLGVENNRLPRKISEVRDRDFYSAIEK